MNSKEMLFRFSDEDILQIETSNQKTDPVSAAFIVRSVNNHDALLDMLDISLAYLTGNYDRKKKDVIEMLRDTIAQAEKGA